MGLFNMSKSGNVSKKQSSKVNMKSKSLDKLIDGELPFGWIAYHKELKEYEDKLTSLAIASRKGTTNERILALESLVKHYNELKSYCYSKNECYKKYFHDYYEHCHNSQNPDFEYITPYKMLLSELRNNYQQLKETETQHQKNLINLENKLLTFLKNNNGILQKDIYKSFDATIKTDIQNLIYQWEKKGIIIRQKQGNTYLIYCKK